jgi:hypothetical protein
MLLMYWFSARQAHTRKMKTRPQHSCSGLSLLLPMGSAQCLPFTGCHALGFGSDNFFGHRTFPRKNTTSGETVVHT